jgi:hypothetical protein
MSTQIFDLCRKERISDLPSRKAVAQPWGTVGHCGQETVAGRYAAQLMEPVPDIHPELFERVSATSYRARGPGSEVVPVVHGKGVTFFGGAQAISR